MSRQLAQQRRRQREALNAAERRSILLQEETARCEAAFEQMQQMQRLRRDREMMAQFVEVFAPEPELVPFPGAQLDLVPTPMPFVPEAPPNG